MTDHDIQWCHCARCRPYLVARYDGAPCAGCGHRLFEGDDITTVDGIHWLHEDCAGATATRGDGR
jgi:hypothetical protein